MRWTVSFAAILVLLCGREVRADDAINRAAEQQLAAVLQWEILWNDPPRSFHTTATGSASLAIQASADTVAYCSHDLDSCAKYSVLPNRNWLRLTSAKCDGRNSDLDALLAWMGQNSVKERTQGVVLGRGGLRGVPAPGVGSLWTVNVNLGSRAEVIQQYRQLHPPELESLERWLHATILPTAGYKALTIGCFAHSDPLVYLYGDRVNKGPVLLAVYWDKERGEWVDAASLEQSQGPEKVEEMYRIVESVACSTVTFQ
jgi:hypothetical protein